MGGSEGPDLLGREHGHESVGLGVGVRTLLALVLSLVEEGRAGQVVLAREVDAPVAVDEVGAGCVAQGQVVVRGFGLHGGKKEK